jgi:endonuclease/exonuclease/phosphatase family metal-dependent hydrolase
MRVVSWNIHGCVGTDRRFDPDRTAGALKRLAPDVALLQEVGDARGVHPPIDQASALADALGMAVTLGITLDRSPFGYGNVTLTRLDTVAAETYDLSVRGREPRLCLCVALTGGLFTANVHFGLRRRERLAQLGILLDELGPFHADVLPSVLLAGDFNDWPPGAVTRTLNSTFTDAALATSSRPPKTFPSRRPLLRLDRIYVGSALAVHRCAVDASPTARTASDHLPVIAEVELALEQGT